MFQNFGETYWLCLQGDWMGSSGFGSNARKFERVQPVTAIEGGEEGIGLPQISGSWQFQRFSSSSVACSEDVELVASSETLECLIITWHRNPNSDHQLNSSCHEYLITLSVIVCLKGGIIKKIFKLKQDELSAELRMLQSNKPKRHTVSIISFGTMCWTWRKLLTQNFGEETSFNRHLLNSTWNEDG